MKVNSVNLRAGAALGEHLVHVFVRKPKPRELSGLVLGFGPVCGGAETGCRRWPSGFSQPPVPPLLSDFHDAATEVLV